MLSWGGKVWRQWSESRQLGKADQRHDMMMGLRTLAAWKAVGLSSRHAFLKITYVARRWRAIAIRGCLERWLSRVYLSRRAYKVGRWKARWQKRRTWRRWSPLALERLRQRNLLAIFGRQWRFRPLGVSFTAWIRLVAHHHQVREQQVLEEEKAAIQRKADEDAKILHKLAGATFYVTLASHHRHHHPLDASCPYHRTHKRTHQRAHTCVRAGAERVERYDGLTPGPCVTTCVAARVEFEMAAAAATAEAEAEAAAAEKDKWRAAAEEWHAKRASDDIDNLVYVSVACSRMQTMCDGLDEQLEHLEGVLQEREALLRYSREKAVSLQKALASWQEHAASVAANFFAAKARARTPASSALCSPLCGVGIVMAQAHINAPVTVSAITAGGSLGQAIAALKPAAGPLPQVRIRCGQSGGVERKGEGETVRQQGIERFKQTGSGVGRSE